MTARLMLPGERRRPPSVEVDAHCDAVRALLADLQARRLDLTRLDREPAVLRVVASMTMLELTCERWRQFADARYLAAQAGVAAEEIGFYRPALAADLRRASDVLRALWLV